MAVVALVFVEQKVFGTIVPYSKAIQLEWMLNGKTLPSRVVQLVQDQASESEIRPEFTQERVGEVAVGDCEVAKDQAAQGLAVSVQEILESLAVDCAAVNGEVGEFDTRKSDECLANKLRNKALSGGSVSQNDVGDIGCVPQDCFYIAVGRKVDATIWPGPVL